MAENRLDEGGSDEIGSNCIPFLEAKNFSGDNTSVFCLSAEEGLWG
jgi:hypothetical protein